MGSVMTGISFGMNMMFLPYNGRVGCTRWQHIWILTWMSIKANFYELFFGLDSQSGEQLSASRRAMSGVFLLLDFGSGGQIKRIFPKNIPLDDIARFANKLHVEHVQHAPATKEIAMAAALKFSEEIAENGIKVGGKWAIGADILAETVDGKLIAREVSVLQGP
ncbi:MAG: hypothetical protein U0905_15860 [Pirellulales bacterium]